MSGPDSLAPLPPNLSATYAAYVDALLAGDWRHCRSIFEQWLDADVPLRTIYTDLVHRSLHDVGVRWERGEVSVAVEHLATSITDSLLSLAYPRLFTAPRNGRSVLVTCLANEYHQVGARLVTDLFELHGWRAYFLGANTPLDDIIGLVRDKRPTAVALSLTVSRGLDTLGQAIAEVRAAFPDMQILVGGQAFEWEGRDRVDGQPGVLYLPSLDALEQWMAAYDPR
jgi:MerR family transcriptional regulator, light-induced transcriptional regulator